MSIGSIAKTGIQAALVNMESISNNIANVNTIGFKKTHVNFADIYAGDNVGGQQFGLGTRVQSVQQDFSVGRIESSDRSLDLRLQNNGFFITKNQATGLTSYTRAGRVDYDADGYLVGFNGVLQGFPVVNGKISDSGNLVDMQVPIKDIPATPTDRVDFRLNLNSNSEIPSTTPFDKDDASSYNYRSQETIFDSLGNSNIVEVFYIKTADNTWDTQILVNDTAAGTGGITYNTDGTIASQTGMTGLSFMSGNGSTTPQTFNLYFNDSTQFAAENKVNDKSHNGNSAGSFVGVAVDGDGKLVASYNNGLTRVEGQLAVAQFQSPQNLLQSDVMSWVPTSDSGPPIVGLDNSKNNIASSSLEFSNVDLTDELVKLISAQHDFQANAQVQQTFNQVMQTIENL